MLNAELQTQIGEEINKSPIAIKKFLTGTYFSETMALISRVNQLTSEQAESVELEVILNILKLNDYSTLREAIEKECKIIDTKNLDQLDLDLHRYVFSVLEKTEIEQKIDTLQVTPGEINLTNSDTSTSSSESVKNISINSESNPTTKSNETLRETIKKSYSNDILGAAKLNEYDAKREAAARKIEQTIAEINIAESLNKEISETKPKQDTPQMPLINRVNSTSNTAPTLKKPETIHDPYREMLDEGDIK